MGGVKESKINQFSLTANCGIKIALKNLIIFDIKNRDVDKSFFGADGNANIKVFALCHTSFLIKFSTINHYCVIY